MHAGVHFRQDREGGCLLMSRSVNNFPFFWFTQFTYLEYTALVYFQFKQCSTSDMKESSHLIVFSLLLKLSRITINIDKYKLEVI